MPILLDISELEPTMVLAADVMNGFSRLLPSGWQLTEEDIAFLQSESPGGLVPVALPALDEMVTFEDQSQEEKRSLETRESLVEAFKQLSEVLRGGGELDEEILARIQLVLVKMLTSVQYKPVKTAVLTDETSDDNYLAHHTANVVYLSVMMGNKIRSYIKSERQRSCVARKVSNATSLTPLALGAFFHDIGLVCSEPFWSKGVGLTQAEVVKIRAHPVKGSEMLDGKIPAMARQVVYCHHENWDGSGYPRGLAGDKINVYARIVRVADAFCAATMSKVYKKAKSAAAVLHEMVYGSYRDCYDPEVSQVLADIVQPFPIGAKLRLKTGESALVVGNHRRNPFQPKVVIAFDKKGKLLPKKIRKAMFFLGDCEEHKAMACGKEDLSFLNGPEEPVGEEVNSQRVARVCQEMLDLVYP